MPAYRVDLDDGRWLIVPAARDEEHARTLVTRCYLGAEIVGIKQSME